MDSFKVVFKKVLRDNLRVEFLLMYLGIVLAPLLMFSLLSEEAKVFANLSLELKLEYLTGFFLLFSFVWICGIGLIMLSVAICSGFVAEEIENRTLLMIVSKPIKRSQFIISKFLAFVVVAVVFVVASLFASIYLWASMFNLDVFSLIRFFYLLLPLSMYSIFIILMFGSMSAAVSVIFSSRIKSIVMMVTLILLTFFVYAQIRGVARSLGVYEKYYLDFLDLGYDLGNVYITLLSKTRVKLVPPVQSIIGMFTGTYEIPRTCLLYTSPSPRD